MENNENLIKKVREKEKVKRKEKEKERTIFIIISYPMKNDEKGKNEASSFFEAIQKHFKIVYSLENEANIKILSHVIKKPKMNNEIALKFSNDEYNFSIEFNFEKESFIYGLKLFKENRLYLNTTDVSQNRISYSEKLNYFI